MIFYNFYIVFYQIFRWGGLNFIVGGLVLFLYKTAIKNLADIRQTHSVKYGLNSAHFLVVPTALTPLFKVRILIPLP